jgi:hypothetical protein
LEVLAAHTAEVSGSITELGTKLSEELEDTAGRLGRSMAGLRKLREQGEQELSRTAQQGALEEGYLHEFRNDILNEVRHVAELLDEAREIGSRMLKGVDFTPAVERISRVGQLVAALVEASAPAAAVNAQDSMAAHAASLEQRYTMASERTVHHEALEGMGVSAPDSLKPGAAATEDTVELF